MYSETDSTPKNVTYERHLMTFGFTINFGWNVYIVTAPDFHLQVGLR